MAAFKLIKLWPILLIVIGIIFLLAIIPSSKYENSILNEVIANPEKLIPLKDKAEFINEDQIIIPYNTQTQKGCVAGANVIPYEYIGAIEFKEEILYLTYTTLIPTFNKISITQPKINLNVGTFYLRPLALFSKDYTFTIRLKTSQGQEIEKSYAHGIDFTQRASSSGEYIAVANKVFTFNFRTSYKDIDCDNKIGDHSGILELEIRDLNGKVVGLKQFYWEYDSLEDQLEITGSKVVIN